MRRSCNWKASMMAAARMWNSTWIALTTRLSARSLDKHAGGPQLRAALVEATKQRTDPYIFINQVNDLNIVLTGDDHDYYVV